MKKKDKKERIETKDNENRGKIKRESKENEKKD